MTIHFDVLVIGGGLAGQSAALRLAKHCRVGLISKRTLEECASARAQGGIAAVLDSQDSVEAHIRDTLTAGGKWVLIAAMLLGRLEFFTVLVLLRTEFWHSARRW